MEHLGRDAAELPAFHPAVEHRDLDDVISRLAASIEADELTIKRLKKRKLKIKDMIAALESRLIPDLDA